MPVNNESLQQNAPGGRSLKKNKPANPSDAARPDLIASLEAQMASIAEQIAGLQASDFGVQEGNREEVKTEALSPDRE